MIYRTVAVRYLSSTPTRPLADFVERFWQISDTPPHLRERIVPSGTIELVLNLRENELRIFDSTEPARCKRFSGAIVSGAYGASFLIDPQQHASAIGVHFKPGGPFPFLRAEASELADTHVDLETLWGPGATELRERLCAAIAEMLLTALPLFSHRMWREIIVFKALCA